jgi:hypothetical protein
VIEERTSASRRARSASKSSTFRNSEAPNLQYGASFQIRVIRSDDESTLAMLLGELDITSMNRFEAAVTEVLSSNPALLIFDLTRSEFVSAQGYDAIGRCSLRLPVQVRSRTGVAARVFTVLGYERVDVVIAPEPREGSIDEVAS